ncbi:MAG: hypothetical protein N4Q03_02400 [Candidatus Lightella neohaematopini]|nr:hypothetical protein [Candidatus Lightella neohaematopini]
MLSNTNNISSSNREGETKFTNKSINAINTLINSSHGTFKKSLKKLVNIMLVNLIY